MNEKHGEVGWTSFSPVSAFVLALETFGDFAIFATKMAEVCNMVY